MDILELIKARHSVRQYDAKSIPQEIRAKLNECAEECNKKGNLNIQIFYDEPDCFNSRLAHYGKFENVSNYIAVVGKKDSTLEERAGYWGECLVLKAQALGLNTCWVALTHGKSHVKLGTDEKEVIIIALGYGKTQGSQRKSKNAKDISNISDDSPQWFCRGIEAALLAPTAINQQKFKFTLNGNKVTAKAGLLGSNLKVDLGIVKYHFEVAAGKENFDWSE